MNYWYYDDLTIDNMIAEQTVKIVKLKTYTRALISTHSSRTLED